MQNFFYFVSAEMDGDEVGGDEVDGDEVDGDEVGGLFFSFFSDFAFLLIIGRNMKVWF
jgi:hypothetical protein